MSQLFEPALSVSLPRQIQCIQRELSFRRRVYPRWVAEGKMTQAKADEEIAVMEAVIQTLEASAS